MVFRALASNVSDMPYGEGTKLLSTSGAVLPQGHDVETYFSVWAPLQTTSLWDPRTFPKSSE